METVINELTKMGESGILTAVEGYTRWYFVHACGWFCVGVAALVASYFMAKKKITNEGGRLTDTQNAWNELMGKVIAGITALTGLIMVIYNLATMLAPQAYAIHCLIGDLKP